MYFVRLTALRLGLANDAEETKTSLRMHCYANREEIRQLCPDVCLFEIVCPSPCYVSISSCYENDCLNVSEYDTVHL